MWLPVLVPQGPTLCQLATPDSPIDRNLQPRPVSGRALSKLLRRAAAATLVQWSAGGALGDAAHYLGINPNGGQYAFTKDLYQWLDNDPARTRFTTALENLAAELDTTAGLIDYRQRRDALHAWSLDGSRAEVLPRATTVCAARQ